MSTRRTGWACLVMALLLLEACASGLRAKPDEAQVHRFAQHGYPVEQQYATESLALHWPLGNDTRNALLEVPNRGGPYPLIIYLPGVGEDATGGVRWRSAWARSGYAVLSVQLLGADLRAVPAPRRPEKRERDRDADAPAPDLAVDYLPELRSHYAIEAMVERLKRLNELIDLLRQRQAQGDSTLARLDLDHLGIAGFDLGAYAAMVAVGEHVPTAEDILASRPILAVVAISPYASFSGMAFNRRYSAIRSPVLSITSDSDADIHGLVTEGVRGAPFQYMPAGNKYLLTLRGVSHESLAGRLDDRLESSELDSDGKTAHSRLSDQGGRNRAVGDDGAPAGIATLTPTARAIALTAAESASTAFFDSTLKGDSIAREWLVKNAPGWLDKVGTIQWR